MIKVGIVDDEILARNVIEDYCSKLDNLEVVLSTGNPIEFINYMQNEKPDLVFLDIKMPELNGLEILRSLLNPPKIILTTAYSEYALDSYNYGVVDYLLKPIKLERFLKAIQKVSVNPILEPKTPLEPEELQVKQDGILINIPFDAIKYIQSFGNYLKIFTDQRMYLILETLTNISVQLPENFQRTHKSYIANLKRVEKVKKTQLYIGDKELPISNTFRILVHDRLKSSL